MNTHPILFTDAMVRAILEGRKTQTRRPIKPQPEPRETWDWTFPITGPRVTPGSYVCWRNDAKDPNISRYCPIQPGDVLQMDQICRTLYDPETGITWYLKGTLAVESVRAERVQDITEDDARAEGVQTVAEFAVLWDSIYGGKPGLHWDANPWVWVYEFRRVAQDITLGDAYDRAGEIHDAAEAERQNAREAEAQEWMPDPRGLKETLERLP